MIESKNLSVRELLKLSDDIKIFSYEFINKSDKQVKFGNNLFRPLKFIISESPIL